MMFIYLGFYMQILLLDIYISVFWLLIVWNNYLNENKKTLSIALFNVKD